jgi:hypothetical protein
MLLSLLLALQHKFILQLNCPFIQNNIKALLTI